MLLNFLMATIVAGTPLIFATLGEIITEKVGNTVGCRRYDVYGCYHGFIVGQNTGNPIFAMLGAAVAGIGAFVLHF